MKNLAGTTLLALLLGTGAFAVAGHHSDAEHDGIQIKHVGYSELGTLRRYSRSNQRHQGR